MKLLIIFALCCGAFASPILKDEEVGQEHVPRFALVPDTEGRMYMADLNAELPESLFNAANDVVFILFTPENQSVGQPIGLNADQIRASNFVSARPTRFIIHGWNGGAGSGLNSNIGSAYHRNGAFNVIVVDWGLGANTINYIAARNRVSDVGVVLANFIDFLHEHGFTDHSRVSIAGHSLGAHVAGNFNLLYFVVRRLKTLMLKMFNCLRYRWKKCSAWKDKCYHRNGRSRAFVLHQFSWRAFGC